MTRKLDLIKILSFIVIALLVLIIIVMGIMLKPTETAQQTSQTDKIPVASVTLAPTTIPTQSNTIITLLDGSKMILTSNSKVKVLRQPGIDDDSQEVGVSLLDGEIMVIPNPLTETWFRVESPTGYNARVQGCAMVVSFDPSRDNFGIQCIAGYCEIGTDAKYLMEAESNNAWTYQNGILGEPVTVNFVILQNHFNLDLPDCVTNAENLPIPQTGAKSPTPTSTATATATKTLMPTIDDEATATAACYNFHEEFPLTPCP